MKILQISFRDKVAGAESIAMNLHKEFLHRGYDARLAVGYKFLNTPRVFEINPFTKTNKVFRPVFEGINRFLKKYTWYEQSFFLKKILRSIAAPKRILNWIRGIEDFEYANLSEVCEDGWEPDIVQLHNLHKDYFNFKNLPSSPWPLFWTLHDNWAFTGHCGYFVDCSKWKDKCGQCPDLQRHPHIFRDQTSKNLMTKKNVSENSKFYLITPSVWLHDIVKKSFLSSHSIKVINNGIDPSIFNIQKKVISRKQLKLSDSDFICMFIAHTVSRSHPYKDFSTVEAAIEKVRSSGHSVKFMCFGSSDLNLPGVTNVGFVENPELLSLYYQSADVLLHAAHIDNYPNVILEAMACGTPVIATDVGGISEQIKDDFNGYLVPRGDSLAMAKKVLELIENKNNHQRLSNNATEVSLKRTIKNQADLYEHYYHEILNRHTLTLPKHID